MSYVPTEWETGDVVTAEKLNNIESGIVNNNIYIASIISNVDESTGEETVTLDKTWQEIFNATQTGRLVRFMQASVEEYPDVEESYYEFLYMDSMSIGYGPVWKADEEKYINLYTIGFNLIGIGPVSFTALNPNDYPVMGSQK